MKQSTLNSLLRHVCVPLSTPLTCLPSSHHIQSVAHPPCRGSPCILPAAVIPQSMKLKLYAAAQVMKLKLHAVAEATESNSSANVLSPTLPKCSTIWT